MLKQPSITKEATVAAKGDNAPRFHDVRKENQYLRDQVEELEGRLRKRDEQRMQGRD